MGAHPYRVPATPPSPKRTKRIAGATVLAVGFGAIVNVLTVVGFGMRRSETAEMPVPAPPPVITNLPDMPEVLFEGSWPDLDVRLIGLDAEKKTALLKLVQHGTEPRLVYSTVDWEKKAFVEQWEATHENAKKLVQEYPAAFNPISGDFTGDLVKLAGLFRRHAFDGAVAFGADPMMAVSDSAIVYDRIPTNGHDGDELWMVDAEGKNARRIDVGLVASYDPVFSPDGEWVAMRACGRPCDYYLHVVDVKHARAPIRVSVADNPRRHVFSADGQSVFVLTRHTEDQAAFWEVPLDAPQRAKKLYDNPKMKGAELYVSPDHKTAVVAGRQRFVFFDLEKREIFRDRLLDAGTLLSMGPNGMLLASDRAGTLFYDPHSEKQSPLANDAWYLQTFWGAWEAPGIAMAVRTKSPMFQLVRLDTRRRLSL